METNESRRSGVRRWIAPGVPVFAACLVALWAAFEFANEVHGYVAAYWSPAVMLFAGVLVVVGVTTVIPGFSRRFGFGAIIGGVALIPVFIAATNVLDATGHIRWRNQPQVRFGPDVRASLVIYLKPGTSNDQINSLWETVMSDPVPSGRGHMHLPGIGGIARVNSVGGHEALAVTIRPNASEDQLREIDRRLKECTYVYKVLRDVVPADVTSSE